MQRSATQTGQVGCTPFDTAEDSWFWAVSALDARRNGVRSRQAGVATRPCDPDDVVKCLDRLYRQRRIDLVHAAVLHRWGMQSYAPRESVPSERADAILWREAMDRLGAALRAKGDVVQREKAP